MTIKANDIKTYAIARMTNNEAGRNLIAEGWTFKFNNRLTRAIGRCCYGPKVIEIGTKFVETLTEAEWKDTVNHEIAHAVTPGTGHGYEWKKMTVKLGAKPSSTAKLEVQPKRKFVIAFKNAMGVIEKIAGADRAPKNLKGTFAKGRKEETLGKLFMMTTAEYEMIETQYKLDGTLPSDDAPQATPAPKAPQDEQSNEPKATPAPKAAPAKPKASIESNDDTVNKLKEIIEAQGGEVRKVGLNKKNNRVKLNVTFGCVHMIEIVDADTVILCRPDKFKHLSLAAILNTGKGASAARIDIADMEEAVKAVIEAVK